MKKYGFFGGSFNPVTKAHIELAIDIVKKYKLDKLIFVPVGDNYKKANLASEYHRYNMLKLAIRQYEKLEVSDIELNQERNLTTLEAFTKIEAMYKDAEKFYIIGADNLSKIILSNDASKLVKNFKYIVIKRGDINCDSIIRSNDEVKDYKSNFLIMDNINHKNTSATNARNNLKNNIAEIILQREVLDYIKKNELY